MVMPYIVILRSKDDIIDNINKMITNADVGTERYIRTDTSGFSIKIICVNKSFGGAVFPSPHFCKDPLNSDVELYERWHEMWSYIRLNGHNKNTVGMYLEAFQEVGFRVAMTYKCPFPSNSDKCPVMFCFTDGVVGFFIFLTYDETLKIDNDTEV